MCKAQHTFGKVTVMKMLSSLKSQFAAFKADESGVSLVEYGLMAAVIVTIVIVAFNRLGNKLAGSFNNVANKL